ncbi:MAG: ribosomal large subunit pseudouridine synthase [Bryobacterales bacterium]|nr:ribosomal large subunit pseudouridine synthase [Bryobacterales bacterium]
MISKAGLGSRTQARSWIHAKRVRVNGQVVENPDHWIDFDRDRVEFDGKPLRIREKVYLLVNKPTGYITTFKDPEGRPTVYDLIGAVETFVSPVGRLDLDTSGLLIMTNDTQLAERLTNPDHHVAKTYVVECGGVIPEESIRLLRNGVELNDGPTRPAAVKRLGGSGASTTLEIVLTEGRNRQVRRMIEAVGSKVVALTRTQIGSIAIGQLAPGEWRPLTPVELDRLRRERS